jgi:hypothetical protein
LKLGTDKRRKEAQRKAYADIERIHQAELAAIEADAAALIPEFEIESAPETVYEVPAKSADALSEDLLTGKAKS